MISSVDTRSLCGKAAVFGDMIKKSPANVHFSPLIPQLGVAFGILTSY